MNKIRTIVRLGLVGIALLSPGYAKAFLQYHLFEKDGKKVLVLGWYHRDELLEENKEIFKALMHYTDLQKQGILPTLQPVNFIFEGHSPEQLKQFKEKPEPSDLLASLRAQNSTQVLSYEAYDPRAESSCVINSILINLLQTARDLEKQSRINPGCMNDVEVCSSMSIASYLQDLNAAENQIKTWRDAFEPSNEVYQVFAQKYDLYKKAHNEVKKVLKVRGEGNLTVAILGLISQYLNTGNISGVEFKGYIGNLWRIFIENSDYVFADSGYLYRALTAKSNLILLVGLDHATDLERNLVHLGYDSVSRAALIKKIPQGVAFNPANFSGYLEQLSSAYFHLVTGYNPEQDIQEKRSEKKLTSACAHCGARSEALLQCSACKNVKYCGTDCQKKHWPAHKKECQKK